MSENLKYIAFLKGKKGEFDAIKNLTTKTLRNVVPLFDVPPPPWDWNEKKYKKSLDDHLIAVAKNIEKNCQAVNHVLIDLFAINLDERVEKDNQHPLTFLFDQLREMKIHATPVTGLDRNEEHWIAVQDIVRKNGGVVSLRLMEEDLFDNDTLKRNIGNVLNTINIPPESVDLLVDFRGISEDQVESKASFVKNVLNQLPHCKKWRSLTVAASGFPENLSKVKKDDEAFIPRAEWKVWKKLWHHRDSLLRLPNYGDYGICHPDLPEIDPRTMKVSAGIRYTLEEGWLIIRGMNLRKGKKGAQFHDLSSKLIKRNEYKGGEFSWGDDYIKKCAIEERGPGNLTTWRNVGTNHHITLVAAQLANLSAA